MGESAHENLRDGARGLIAYTSSNPFEFTQIVTGEGGDGQTVFGHLLFPDVYDGPVPCIVACHGSFNWRGHHYDHIARFLDMGFAVFRVHTFDARGAQDISANQMDVTAAMMMADAYGALRLVATHPDIDETRIGLAGWSLGGCVALYAAWTPIAEALAPEGERFAAHLPVYPAAHIRCEDNRWTGAPVRILIGAAEDYTPASHALALSTDLQKQGFPAETIAYRDAYHSFDSLEYVTFMPDAIALEEAVTVTIRVDGSMVITGTDADVSTPEGRLIGFADLARRGAHVGGHRQARRRAFADAESFLRAHLTD